MTVYLVGAGPGDPGLVTVRGRELVERCDAIVYDRLADPRIVALAPEAAEKVYAGKRPGEHAMTQERLNALLVELGGRLETVVRLKGGDPFVFGRGGEEALALEGAGIAFEIVPGVSSAHAVPAYAGIPVTQRGTAAQVTFVTGHEDPARPESAIDWGSLAATPGTLVFLMGVGALEENARRLIAHGMRADTPAAVISHGTRPDQRTVTAPLARIADAASELPAPAITVVGEVALLREHLAWFERRPLHGLRVVVTRARAQASGLRARLEELGAAVTEAPAIRIEPLPFDPPDLSAFDLLVLTSANGVERILPADVRALAGVTVAADRERDGRCAPGARHRRRRGSGAGGRRGAPRGARRRRRQALPRRRGRGSARRGARRALGPGRRRDGAAHLPVGARAGRSRRRARRRPRHVHVVLDRRQPGSAPWTGETSPASGPCRSARSRAPACGTRGSSRSPRPIRTTSPASSRRCSRPPVES